MSDVQILDCTLRDGGYINDFNFGQYGIRKIISQLTLAGIDIIECGFLEDCEYDPNYSVFNKVEQIAPFIPADHASSMYVAMACYGEYDINQLSPYDGKSIDGIRVSFHYNEIEEAIDFCWRIKELGYKLFLQPVGTTSYTKTQLLSLIDEVNRLKPYSFYFVDTLGLMKKKDVLEFFKLIDANLSSDIHMGFHSHNNLQLSFSNSQTLIDIETNRVVSLDSSVYGMGRGAGNLSTELITNYLNGLCGLGGYVIEPILEIVDEFIVKIKSKHEWGYSVPYYLAAINGCHPNYAAYLSSKQRLTVKNISKILRSIELDKRSLFDKELAEKKYLEFQSREIDDTESVLFLKEKIEHKAVLVLAPGPSINEYQETLQRFVKDKNCITISVGFVPLFMDCDYTFLSNLKRYHTTFNPEHKRVNLIHTSNIEVQEEEKLVVNYSSLLCENDIIMDNTAMMLLNLLLKLHPSRVFLAGLDGYKEKGDNFYQERLVMSIQENVGELNVAMTNRIKELSREMPIEFITPSLYNS